jgi:hypothetical protein
MKFAHEDISPRTSKILSKVDPTNNDDSAVFPLFKPDEK